MMKPKYLLFTFLALLVMGGQAFAADIIAKPGYRKACTETDCFDHCDDASGWTASDLEAAVVAAGTNGHLCVCNGAYTGIQLDDPNKRIAPIDGITIEGESQSGVILDGDGGEQVVYAVNDDSWTMKNLSVTGATHYGIRILTSVADNCDDITLDNLTVYSSGVSGIYYNGDDVALTGNVVQNCTIYSNGTSGATSHGINIIKHPSGGIIIQDCGLYQNGYYPGVTTDGRGISVANGSTGIIIRDCDIYQNGYTHGCGVEVYGGGATVYQCTIYDNQNPMEVKGSPADVASITAYNNILVGDDGIATGEWPTDGTASETTVALHNNTIYCSSDGSYGITLMGPSATIQNNIIDFASVNSGVSALAFKNMTNAEIDNCTISHNYWYHSASDHFAIHDEDVNVGGVDDTYADIAALQVDHAGLCSGGTSSTTADPLFIDAANDDFHLQIDSPCIDAGLDVGQVSDFDGWPMLGLAWNIGAYEERIYYPQYVPKGLNISSIGKGPIGMGGRDRCRQ